MLTQMFLKIDEQQRKRKQEEDEKTFDEVSH